MNTNQPFDLELTRAQASERSFISQVYLWMALGLALTAMVAWGVAASPSVVMALVRNPFLFLMMALVQIGLVMWLSSAVLNMSLTTATVGFSIYATLNGVIFSTIFLAYTYASIASTFLTTALTFGAISIYGFTTRKDLTSVGSFAFMALIGLIVASLVNLFLRSAMFDLVLSYIGVLIFVGLTAYDTQQLKRIHEQGFAGGEALQKMSLLGALKLYLDFINLFLLLLRIMGRRRD